MTNRTFNSFAYFIALLLFFSGCATKVVSPCFIISNENQGKEIYGSRFWEKTLKKYVDEKGRTSFKNLAFNHVDLLFYLNYIAKTSPQLYPKKFPDKKHKLTFYINSYNALAMYGIVYHKIPKDFNRFIDRLRFFKFTEYNIGGMHISLYDYENKIIRPMGDPRVHFALNCMVVDCPRLPDTPFAPDMLDSQLNEASVEFLNDPQKVFVDHSKKIVMVSEILKFYKEDFVNSKQAASLLEYINRFRETKIPSSYRIGFFNYDWTVNNQ
jgi:hypothetical protein